MSLIITQYIEDWMEMLTKQALLTSLYFVAPLGSNFLLFNSLLLSQRSRLSAVTHGHMMSIRNYKSEPQHYTEREG